jgi:hypothetical protein
MYINLKYVSEVHRDVVEFIVIAVAICVSLTVNTGAAVLSQSQKF